MPTFATGDVTMFYEERGQGEPVVFVHGTLCDYRSWSAQADALSSKYRTILYSRRYARPNNREGDVMDSTVQNNSEDLLALIRQLGLDKVHLVGHSYGGFIATYFATQHPERLGSLTLINAAVGTVLVKDASAVAALSLLLKSPGVAASARKFLNATRDTIKALDNGDPTAVNTIFVPALENGRTDLPAKPEGFSKMVSENARTLKETTTPFPQVGKREIARIHTPTLVVWGELSAPWDSEISGILAGSIPGSQRAKITGAGHFCLNERPEAVNVSMDSFLRRLPR